ncbi:hypothetical protein PYCC9005_003736 [Savitreella phatthalungensis]
MVEIDRCTATKGPQSCSATDVKFSSDMHGSRTPALATLIDTDALERLADQIMLRITSAAARATHRRATQRRASSRSAGLHRMSTGSRVARVEQAFLEHDVASLSIADMPPATDSHDHQRSGATEGISPKGTRDRGFRRSRSMDISHESHVGFSPHELASSQRFRKRGREYSFSIVSAPRQSSVNVSSETHDDNGAMTPPLVARLRMLQDESDPAEIAHELEISLPYLMAQVTYPRPWPQLLDDTTSASSSNVEVRGARTASGQVFSNQRGEKAAYFIFPDLHILTEGNWTAHISLVAFSPQQGEPEDSFSASVLTTVAAPHPCRVTRFPLSAGGLQAHTEDIETFELLAGLRQQNAPIRASASFLDLLEVHDIGGISISAAQARALSSDSSVLTDISSGEMASAEGSSSN